MVLKSTHNLCLGSKLRKLYTLSRPGITIYNWGSMGSGFKRTCFPDGPNLFLVILFAENGNQWGQDRNGINPAQSWNVQANQMQQPYVVAQTSSNQMMDSNQLMQSPANQGVQQSSTNHERQQSSTNQDRQSSTNEMDQRDNSKQSELTVQKAATQIAMYALTFFLYPANSKYSLRKNNHAVYRGFFQ